MDVAARLTIPDSPAVQQRIGIDRKSAHLRALHDYWVERARDVPGVEILLPVETGNDGAISAFRLRGLRTMEQARETQARFLAQHRVLVVAKSGLASGRVMRVTPALFNNRRARSTDKHDADRAQSVRLTTALFAARGQRFLAARANPTPTT